MKRLLLLATALTLWPLSGFAQTNDDLNNNKNTDHVVAHSMGLDRGSYSPLKLINKTNTAVSNALNKLRSTQSTLGSNSTVLSIRLEFTKNYVTGLTQGSDKLTLADLNEEGANLSTLQTRQQLGTVSLSISTKSEQGLLRLF